jgi:heat shock protein HtpX
MSHANLNPETQRNHNRRNALHTALLIGGTGLLMGLMAYAVLGIPGLIGATVFGAVGLASLGRMSPKMVLNLYKARPFTEDEMPELHQLMRQLAKRADLHQCAAAALCAEQDAERLCRGHPRGFGHRRD